MTLLMVVLFVLLFFVALPIAGYRYDRSPDRREQAVTAMLQSTRLQVNDQTRAILRERMARRLRWGAIGEDIGLLLSVPLCFALLHAKLALPTFIVIFMLMRVGNTTGYALSGLNCVRLADDQPRFASMYPHEAGDYLHRQEVVAQGICGFIGVAVTLTSLLVFYTHAALSGRWIVALLLGAALIVVVMGTSFLQNRLVRAPVRGGETSQLVAQQLTLALTLRDLFYAVVTTTGLSIYGFVLSITDSLFIPLLVAALWVLAIHSLTGERIPPRLTVARELAKARVT